MTGSFEQELCVQQIKIIENLKNPYEYLRKEKLNEKTYGARLATPEVRCRTSFYWLLNDARCLQMNLYLSALLFFKHRTKTL